MRVTHPIGSVWVDNAWQFVIVVTKAPDVNDRMMCVVLDGGASGCSSGSLYDIHIDSLPRYYERIA